MARSGEDSLGRAGGSSSGGAGPAPVVGGSASVLRKGTGVSLSSAVGAVKAQLLSKARIKSSALFGGAMASVPHLRLTGDKGSQQSTPSAAAVGDVAVAPEYPFLATHQVSSPALKKNAKGKVTDGVKFSVSFGQLKADERKQIEEIHEVLNMKVLLPAPAPADEWGPKDRSGGRGPGAAGAAFLLQLLTLESSAPASASPNSPASSSSESSGDDEDALGTLAGHPDRRDSAVEAGGAGSAAPVGAAAKLKEQLNREMQERYASRMAVRDALHARRAKAHEHVRTAEPFNVTISMIAPENLTPRQMASRGLLKERERAPQPHLVRGHSAWSASSGLSGSSAARQQARDAGVLANMSKSTNSSTNSFEPSGQSDLTPQRISHDFANNNNDFDPRKPSAAGPGSPRSPGGPPGQFLGLRKASSRNLLGASSRNLLGASSRNLMGGSSRNLMGATVQRQSSFVNRASSFDSHSGRDGVNGSGGEATFDVNTFVRREQFTPRPPQRLSFSSPPGRRPSTLLGAAKISAPNDVLQPLSSPASPEFRGQAVGD
jgi:hypothetical protein